MRGLAWGGSSRPTPRGRASPGPHPGGKSPGPHLGGSPGPHSQGEGGLQAHTWGASPGPHPGGSLQAHTWPGGHLQAHTQMGEVSRPTPRGVSRPTLTGGGGLQAHTQGVSRPTAWGRSPGPHLGGDIPACTETDTRHPDGYCCGRYASYWNAFLFRQSLDGNWTGITVMPKYGHRYRYNSSCSVKTSM